MRYLNRLFALLFAACLLHPALAIAAAPATVELVQAPAWVERGGRPLALAPGMELKSGDVVRTGEGARAYLRLAEGSRVKLGEGARFGLHTRSMNPERNFRGALDVLTGAFRFTTGKVRKSVSREVAIRVGTATVGIRGTDIWGKTDKDGDLVALIEGRIEITRGGATTEMGQAMSYYDAPRGKEAEVKPLDAAVFARLARQTEILGGDGAAGARGKWRIMLASMASQDAALETYDAAHEAGFAARIKPVAAEDGSWRYEITVRGFANATEAEAVAARLKRAVPELKPVVSR